MTIYDVKIWICRIVRSLSFFAWRDLVFDAARVEWKFGRNDDGSAIDWTEWADLRDDLRETGSLRKPEELSAVATGSGSLSNAMLNEQECAEELYRAACVVMRMRYQPDPDCWFNLQSTAARFDAANQARRNAEIPRQSQHNDPFPSAAKYRAALALYYSKQASR